MLHKRKKKKHNLKKSKKTGIIHVLSGSKNTILTLTDIRGNTKAWSSPGTVGFKNARKSTGYASQAAIEKIVQKGKDLGYKQVIVCLRGSGYGKRNATRLIHKRGLKVIKIKERTAVPHNGCRKAKKRRT